MFNSKKGFTLVEIMIVVGIIAILAGIFLVGSGQFRASANAARIKADIQKIEALQELYYTQSSSGSYAPDEQELSTTLNIDFPEEPINSVEYSTNGTESCARGTGQGDLPANLGLGTEYCLVRL